MVKSQCKLIFGSLFDGITYSLSRVPNRSQGQLAFSGFPPTEIQLVLHFL